MFCLSKSHVAASDFAPEMFSAEPLGPKVWTQQRYKDMYFFEKKSPAPKKFTLLHKVFLLACR